MSSCLARLPRRALTLLLQSISVPPACQHASASCHVLQAHDAPLFNAAEKPLQGCHAFAAGTIARDAASGSAPLDASSSGAPPQQFLDSLSVIPLLSALQPQPRTPLLAAQRLACISSAAAQPAQRTAARSSHRQSVTAFDRAMASAAEPMERGPKPVEPGPEDCCQVGAPTGYLPA